MRIDHKPSRISAEAAIIAGPDCRYAAHADHSRTNPLAEVDDVGRAYILVVHGKNYFMFEALSFDPYIGVDGQVKAFRLRGGRDSLGAKNGNPVVRLLDGRRRGRRHATVWFVFRFHHGNWLHSPSSQTFGLSLIDESTLR